MSIHPTPDTALEQRDARALTECMTVLPHGPDIYAVVSESGREHAVDTRDGHCTCRDYRFRAGKCKHHRRVEFATGERAIPAWADRGAVDELLGEQTSGPLWEGR